MMTLIMGFYHVMSLIVAGILLWLFIREDKSWERSLIYLISIFPFIVRILRIR